MQGRLRVGTKNLTTDSDKQRRYLAYQVGEEPFVFTNESESCRRVPGLELLEKVNFGAVNSSVFDVENVDLAKCIYIHSHSMTSDDSTLRLGSRIDSTFNVQISCGASALSYSISLVAIIQPALLNESGIPKFLPLLCYMTPDKYGVHSCREWRSLPPRRYNVSLYLYRRPMSQCNQRLGVTSTIFDFIILNNFSYRDVFNCFQYGMEFVKEVEWSKNGFLGCSNRPHCSVDEPGAWYAEGQGNHNFYNLDSKINQSNISSTDKFIYRPFHCQYKFFTKEEAAYCLLKNPVAYLGDSRDRNMITHIYKWLDLDTFGVGADQELIKLMWPGPLGYIGWMSAVGTPSSMNKTKTLFKQYINNNFTIVLQGIAHDTAEFPAGFPTSRLREFFPNHACASCNATTVGECGKVCEKPFPLLFYKNNILSLRQILVEVKNEISGSKIFWMTHHKRPPRKESDTKELTAWHWQMHDIYVSLEDFAVQTFRDIGIPIIDLRYMAFAAPPSWWNDALHYVNRKQTSLSAFKHMGMHIFLNHICIQDFASS